eukprot:1830008-Pyramimonas_sp.AAC.2
MSSDRFSTVDMHCVFMEGFVAVVAVNTNPSTLHEPCNNGRLASVATTPPCANAVSSQVKDAFQIGQNGRYGFPTSQTLSRQPGQRLIFAIVPK